MDRCSSFGVEKHNFYLRYVYFRAKQKLTTKAISYKEKNAPYLLKTITSKIPEFSLDTPNKLGGVQYGVKNLNIYS